MCKASNPLVVANELPGEISGVAIEDLVGYRGPPIFVVPKGGILRNVTLQVIGHDSVKVTPKPGYYKNF